MPDLTLKEWLALLVLLFNALLSFLDLRQTRAARRELEVLNGKRAGR